MFFKEIPLWLYLALCIAGLGVAMALHLALHPLRRHFSDGMDFLRTHRLPLVVIVTANFFSSWLRPPGAARPLAADESWWDQGGWLVFLKEAATAVVLLFHQALPPWPAALLLPVWTVTAAVCLLRFPFRYQSAKPRMEQRLGLAVLAVLSLAWSAGRVFTLADPSSPWSLHVGMLAADALFMGLAVAAFQVWLARLVIDWADPSPDRRFGDAPGAMHECIRRWLPVLGLGVFNTVAMTFLEWSESQDRWQRWSLVVEFLLLFAALPAAIALTGGSFITAGGQALRAWLRRILPLIGFAISAAAMLWLAESAIGRLDETFASWPLDSRFALGLRALVLGLMQSWLAATGILILYRGGFRDTDGA